MMSRKWMVGLMAVVLMVALAPNSFAQIELRLFNTPSAQEVQTNRHVRTADINSTGAGLLVSGVLIANSTLTTTTLTLTFPATITSSLNFPSAAEGIRIEGATGVFAQVTTLTVGTSSITLSLPGFPPCAVTTATCLAPGGNNESGSFRLTGVSLDGNSLTAPVALSGASLSSSANNYIAPSGSLPSLITALGAGIASLNTGGTFTGTGAAAPTAGTSAGTIIIFTNQATGTPSDDNATITIGEGFASAWRTSTQNAVNGVADGVVSGGIRLTITGLPAGMTATITPRATTGAPTFNEVGQTLDNVTAGGIPDNRTWTFATTNLSTTQTASFDVVVAGTPTGTLGAGSITLTATMAPVQTEPSPYRSGNVPKFAASEVGPLTIGNIVIAKTTMLIPYAVSIGASGGTYNTGIAIANTTRDPFGASGGGATQTEGGLTFYLFQRSSTGFAGTATITTSATVQPGAGLSSTGTVVSGGLWSGLMSELMGAQSTLTGDFIGYMFIEANFLNAHGVAYLLTGNSTISSGLPVAVLPPPAAVNRNNLPGFSGTSTGVEFLGF